MPALSPGQGRHGASGNRVRSSCVSVRSSRADTWPRRVPVIATGWPPVRGVWAGRLVHAGRCAPADRLMPDWCPQTGWSQREYGRTSSRPLYARRRAGVAIGASTDAAVRSRANTTRLPRPSGRQRPTRSTTPLGARQRRGSAGSSGLLTPASSTHGRPPLAGADAHDPLSALRTDRSPGMSRTFVRVILDQPSVP